MFDTWFAIYLLVFVGVASIFAQDLCNQPTEIYDPDQRRCLLKTGSDCALPDHQCVPGAKCVIAVDGVPRCSCLNGKSVSANGTCLLSGEEFCGTSVLKQCNADQGLVCKEGYCTCKYEQWQTFNRPLRKCVSRVLGPCNNSTACVEFSNCSDASETFQQCVCNPGFVAVAGECQLEFGAKCEYINNNQRGWRYKLGSLTCDLAAPLKCIDGICQCEHLEEYDSKSKICKGLVGAICSTKDRDYCTLNAECGKRRDRHLFAKREERDGFCECMVGFTANQEKRCVA